MTTSKILILSELSGKVAEAKAAGKKVVHCHGVFDLLHIGHIRYFDQAKAMGDLLIVTMTPDQYVDKGAHRPAFQEDLRIEAIASLEAVDFVSLNEWKTAEETLRLLKPDVYVKGSEFKTIQSDMTGKIGQEAEVVREIGAELAFTEDIVFSSSNLINQYISIYPEEVKHYLDLFRNRHPEEQIMSVIEGMEDLKVLVVGDTIVDEYVYCDAIGKSSKDPVLAIKYQAEDSFAGGIVAIANHVACFAKQVDMLSVLGTEGDKKGFIESHIAPNVNATFFEHPGAPTVTKRRFIEGYSLNKLLEIYFMDESGLPPDVDKEITGWLKKNLERYDVVLVADYGHGAVSNDMVNVLSEQAPFLVVNTQANAGNRGYHMITRYPKLDVACIAEHEMRLEARDPKGDLKPLMDRTAPKLGAELMIVTRGKKGCLMRRANGGLVAVPAFATKVVDRVGAGDAFLSVAALAAVQKADPEIVGFLGCLAGAQAVEMVGNEKSIDKLQLKKHVVSVMK